MEEEFEFKMKRKVAKDARMNKRSNRAVTANQFGDRRVGSRLNTNPDEDLMYGKKPPIQKTDSKIDVLYERLKAC